MKEQCERLEGHPDLTAENPSGALLYAHGAFGPLRSARVTGWGHFYSCLLTERLQAKGRGDLKAPACIRSHAQKEVVVHVLDVRLPFVTSIHTGLLQAVWA